GKELFAHAIHNASARKNAPFVVVNCGALPRDLIQSELFGYDPGAFTGAQKQGKPGKFELAEGGTIFLDEIGDMPLEAQINLLRVIQNKEVSRIGGKFSRPIDVRIIAATNKRLQQSVRDGSFREDLFYRLSVLTIDVPPLRERQQDVMLLAESFLRAGVQAIHKPCRGFSAEVAEIFSRYPWPGNVRELENIVERSLNIARGDTIEREDLPLSLLEREDEDLGGRNRWQAAPAPGNSPAAALPGRDTGRGGTLQSREVEILLDVLKANGGNMRKTAQELGIARSALYAKLHRMGIDIAALRSGR
ncbi:sigma-54 interaction domain-containing protein, partial [Desulfovibrio piger]|uniref:sigma-54 interaction domain-containing protein n=3 Tax=Desulfovibrio TaxID=872 RepID=UPI0026F009F6